MTTKPIDVFEFDQPNLPLIPLTIESGLSGMRVSMKEEVAFSKLGSGENFSDFTPLLTIVPPGAALSADMHNDIEVLGLGSTLEIYNWVKQRIPGFSKLVGLLVSCHERLCIAYLQWLEREMEVDRLRQKKTTVN